ncbi:hypothetical protein [Sorangium sp. So ce233]|uniref:hypothetical protein n=1 Tax=Sorangium sp. So ce233 TaxID=3133290 RepID=UPI003F634908
MANGARGYEAEVAFYRDGSPIGSGRWDAEGFEDCVGPAGRPLDLGDGESVAWEALSKMVREHLATLPAPDEDGLVLAL